MLPASRGRLILAIYLDFILFSVPWGLFEHFVLRENAEFQRLSGPFKFVTFTLIELLLHRIIRWSPGQRLLGITTIPNVEGAWVDAELKARETWLSLVMGVVLLLEGSKGLVRWTMWTPPPPFFGAVRGDEYWPEIAMTVGAIECLIAYLFFRARLSAVFAGAVYFATMLVSTVMSWSLWDAWAADHATRRRAYQGIPLRDDEIAQAQSIMPEALIGGLVLYLVGTLAAGAAMAYKRKRQAVAEQIDE